MRKAIIITNPAAARSREAGLTAARERLIAGGMAVDIERTGGPGDAERIARAAVADGADLLIAHGGDGTVMEVATALVGSERPLGLLPAGTGNLLAGNLGIRRSWRAASDVITGGACRVIDLGRLTTAAGSRVFAVAAGAGFDAELMRRTEARHKRAFGMVAYIAKAMDLARTITRSTVRIECGDFCHEGPAALVLIANCGEIVPGLLPIHPDIRPDDGVFDVAVLDASTFPGAARLVWFLLLRRPHFVPGITLLRADRVTLTAEPPFPVQADGEAAGTTPMTVEVLPRALHVLAPRGA